MHHIINVFFSRCARFAVCGSLKSGKESGAFLWPRNGDELVANGNLATVPVDPWVI